MSRSGRRQFLSQLATTGLATGIAPSLLAAFEEPLWPHPHFAPNPQDNDARVFAAARRELLIPRDITFCNTGTFGACPREVIDAVADSLRTVERELPDWAYRNTDLDE